MSEKENKGLTLDFEIDMSIGVLSESGTWSKELNFVRWGKNPAKYDIRSWNREHNKASKGITLTTEELIALRALLNDMDLEAELNNDEEIVF